MPNVRNPIRIVCSVCGTTNVSRDAWAEWDENGQAWTLRNVYDAAWCHRCDTETSLSELAIEPLRK